MRRWLRRLLVGLGVVTAFGAAAFAGSLSLERSFLYHPQPRGAGPDAGSGIEVVEIATADGERLVGWWLPPKDGKPVILFFHGNASTPEGDVGRWRRIADEGAGFLAIAYRGYGGSTGTPTEKGLYQDSLAAYDWVTKRTPAGNVVIHGFSLGSGVAVRLASEKPARALVLEAPYTSIVDMAGRVTSLPVGSLVRDRFMSSGRIARVRMPVLMIHGDRDSVIPFEQGQRLYALAHGPKTFVRMIGSDHNTLTRDGAYDHIWRFLGLPVEGTTAAPGFQAESRVSREL
jgi:fermentation-respiration switch protein FrsA (DUF1100 family)